MSNASTDKPRSKHTYGPVPSRRLGLSLGIDLVPHKICSFDCIYCQLGRTTEKTIDRKDYTPVDEILEDVKEALARTDRIDHVTFAGSGEPTLHKSIGCLIDGVKSMTDIPVAVLTNGSMLVFPDVRKDLAHADVVIPTLCAVDQATFERIHRPHETIRIEDVIKAYTEFRRGFVGKIWLEVMLISDINDRPASLKALRRAIDGLAPDMVHLNTVVRPPSEAYARPVSAAGLEAVRALLGPRAEVIAEFRRSGSGPSREAQTSAILAMIERRPVTVGDLVAALGIHENEIVKATSQLIAEQKIKLSRHGDQEYYELRRKQDD